MKRLWHILLGLWIIAAVGFLLFLQIDHTSIKDYQDQLLSYSWFLPALYWTAGALMFIGLLYIIFAFKPSHRSRELVTSFSDGELVINKKSIEKNVLHTVQKYDQLRQPSIDVKLFQKKQSSYMDVHVDVFATNTNSIQSYLTQLREEIKKNAEHFAELPVREVKVNLLDQKTLKKRVL